MKFSIVVPAYNSEKTIRNCLNSILSQTFNDFEVIVINDGSKDSTLDILSDYAYHHKRIHVYSFKNAGVSIARQRGVSLSNGDYIVFVDADDSINHDLLQNLYFAICTSNQPEVIRFQANLVDDSSYKDHQRYNFFDATKTTLTGMSALKHWSVPGKKYAVYWIFAFKKTVFNDILFFPHLKCYEDIALIPVLIAKSDRVVTLNYVGYNYTCNNPDSLTNTRSIEAERSRAIDFVKAYNYAVGNITKLDNISSLEFAFFVEDYNKRLQAKFQSLSEDLKAELAPLFGI